MKRYKLPYLLLMLLTIVLALAGCGQQENKPGGEQGERIPDLVSTQPQSSVVAFFKTPDCELLTPISFGINSSRDTIWIALEKLLAGPPDGFVEGVIPAGIKIKELYFAGGQVHIGLTGDEPLALADVNLLAIWATVNKELLEQDNTTAALRLYYNDEPLLAEPYTAEAVNDFGGGAAGARVYFSDPQAMYLVPLALPVFAADYASDGEYLAAVMTAWAAAPPEGSGVFSPLPEGAELLDCRLEGDLLLLDFGPGLQNIASSSEGRLLLNSLLSTLARFPQVNQVQLLCGGEALAESLPGGTDFSQPLPVAHDLDMINRLVQ